MANGYAHMAVKRLFRDVFRPHYWLKLPSFPVLDKFLDVVGGDVPGHLKFKCAFSMLLDDIDAWLISCRDFNVVR